MADEQPQSIAERIAALKLNKAVQVPSQPPPTYDQATNGTVWVKRPPPPPRPDLPARPNRMQSSNVPTTADYATVSNGGINNLPEGEPSYASANGMDGISRPALPPRISTQSSQASQGPGLPPRRPTDSPALPSRRPSEALSVGSRRQSEYSLSRKASNESMSSTTTARSGMSNGTSVTSQSDRYSVKAPSYDPSALPALPPKKTQEEKAADYKKYNSTAGKRGLLKPTKSTPNVQPKQVGTTPPPPPRPLGRTSTQPAQSVSIQEEQASIEPPPRQREIAPPPPKRSALSMGLNNSTNTTPPVPNRPGSVPQADGNGAPPPIPTSSRPDLSALQASKPKPSTTAAAAMPSAPTDSCLLCRDFSAPDNHAARFPRESIPSQDVGWLANQLCTPFTSQTDKARAIFTWLHHNISYDTQAFFNNAVKPSTPQSTLQSGWAVCEGYAGLFAALAMKAGLEAVVVGGDGKGYGYKQLQPGEPIPPYKAGHAWNAVKIDGGQWKLIDACWGAGHICGANNLYKKEFSPERFTQSNDEFGLDHYPGDSSKQLRNDGRVVSWEEYILGQKNGCGADFFAGYIEGEGLSKPTFRPADGKIRLSQQGPTVRFSFQKKCPHFDPIRNGKGPYYMYTLHLDGLNGTKRNNVPFETNGDVWWCDVKVQDLGQPGMKVAVNCLTKIDGGDGRGLTVQRYREKWGRCGWSAAGVAKWEVAA